MYNSITIRLLLGLFLLYSLVACNKNNSANSNPNSSDSLANANQSNTSANGENFNTFYAKFCSSSDFQKSRITFPLPTRSYTMTQQSIDSTLWEAKNWEEYTTFEVFQQQRKAKEDSGPWKEEIDSSNPNMIVVKRFLRHTDAGSFAIFEKNPKGEFIMVKFFKNGY